MTYFEAIKDVHVSQKKIRRKKYKDDLPVLEKFHQEKRHVDPKFKKNYKLEASTAPEDYADIFYLFQ